MADSTPAHWFREREFWLMVGLVAAIYFSRLTLLPPCGEETRVATMAQEMIASGDWIVPRQQGTPFPERPPLGAWSMAVFGVLRGNVDTLAIRLPSAVALLATCVLIYAYARSFLAPLGALASAAAYATFGQVLQIGRHGESEPLFTLFVGASLFVWHYGMQRGWPLLGCWTAGFGLAAIGAFAKGPQAPIYFVTVTGAYLLWRREWRKLFCWQFAAGGLLFVGVIALWLVPFYYSAGASAVSDIWMLLAKKRFGLGGMLKHLVAYPVETLACLLPWSPLAVHLLSRNFRDTLRPVWPHVQFLVISVAVTYPSVLFAAGARGRYYMPLYPCIAVLLGMVLQYSVHAPAGTFAERGWRRFLGALAVVCGMAGVIVPAASVVPWEKAQLIAQPLVWAVLFACGAIAACGVALWARRETELRATTAVLTLTAFFGMTYTGLVINARYRDANDLTTTVAQAKSVVPEGASLVSLGPVAHQFAYAYREDIAEKPWPVTLSDVDPAMDYFCFHRGPDDNDTVQHVGRGMTHVVMPGKLPFQWEELSRVYYGRDRHDRERYVILARVVRDVRLSQRSQTSK